MYNTEYIAQHSLVNKEMLGKQLLVQLDRIWYIDRCVHFLVIVSGSFPQKCAFIKTTR